MTFPAATPASPRIGIFGGTFDPIHLGHLIVAEHFRDRARLNQVWFIPCARQPLKDRQSTTTDRQRCEMIELAIAGHQDFFLSKIELERGGVSYTVETLEQIRELQPEAELFLLIGEDSLGTFHQWKQPERICELAMPLVFPRPGDQVFEILRLKRWVSEDRLQQVAAAQIGCPQVQISSTDIRNRIQSNRTVRYLLPRSVEKYIESQQLYRAG
jgi:nicotinate-nucleotide adenylyltransferase